MLPTNVIGFMKKMVATDGGTGGGGGGDGTADTTFGKIKQTLSSSLMNAQDKVTLIKPRPSLIPEPEPPPPEPTPTTTSTLTTTTTTTASSKPEPGKPPNRSGACRVCLKSFKADDYSRTCCECQQKVCEDCASYSKIDDSEEQSTWRCSICRRKLQSRSVVPQDSTDSLLEVPVMDTLQRRHSDVKLGSSTGGLTVGGAGSIGLAPPRSPELRRHSDVSPASLKELEKLKGGSHKSDMDWARSRGSRSGAPSRSSSPPRRESNASVVDAAQAAAAARGRRMSRVQRQHSYDDEIKAAGQAGNEGGLGLPAPMPRRASAYDVYAPGVLAAAQAAVAAGGGGRNSDLPIPVGPGSRRPSFRVPPSDEQQKDNSPSPDQPVVSTLGVDPIEQRRGSRRGSQLPDIATLRALPTTPWSAAALEELEAPRRQASIDGEAIKIVIHDVDSGLPVTAAKRRVVLRRDPADKTHRTRGFGMRVVGGKTGADGRLFAYIVWTVPGGPAEKGGLQQGDKVLEWCGVSLTDRSFEEVCAIMDRTGDVAELLVEHATDFGMCDLLDEPSPCLSRKLSDAGPITGLQIEPETDKTPSSPTRRKLPKTPV